MSMEHGAGMAQNPSSGFSQPSPSASGAATPTNLWHCVGTLHNVITELKSDVAIALIGLRGERPSAEKLDEEKQPHTLLGALATLNSSLVQLRDSCAELRTLTENTP